MNKPELIDQNQLAEIIDYHNRLYFEKAAPEIDDVEFDRLTEQLRKLNPSHPVLHKLYNSNYGDKVKLRIPMLSLDKAYSVQDVLSWAKKWARSEEESFLIQPKFDGVSAWLSHGTLVTRGDGNIGENITDKLPLIKLDTHNSGEEIRGEIVIRTDEFAKKWQSDKIRAKSLMSFKNIRNTVAGIIGQKECAEIQYFEEKYNTFLYLVDYDRYSIECQLSKLESSWESMLQKIQEIPYPLDGLVVKLADTIYSESLGSTAHHPRGQIAFKFKNQSTVSTLLKVDWFNGKNSLTPVGVIAPIELGGSTITNVTLHNAQNVIDKDIHIGDKLLIERAGDVIPYVKEILPGKTRSNALIKQCPSCNTDLVMRSVELACPNPECPGTLLQRLLGAVKCVGIEELGEPTLKEMQIKLNVKHLRDIFQLDDSQLFQLKGFAEKKVLTLRNQIEQARQMTPEQFLASLNIPGIGIAIAKLILQKYAFSDLRHAKYEDFIIQKGAKEEAVIAGIGPERARAVVNELAEQSSLIDEMLDLISLKEDSLQTGRPTICFTGKMPEKRAYYVQLAEFNHYDVVDIVTQSLSLLVVADEHEVSSKTEKATKFGVKKITLDQWLTEIQQPSTQTITNKDDLFSNLLF